MSQKRKNITRMPDFWDVDTLLTTEESIDCVFVTRGVGLGHLDPLRASTGARDVCYSCYLHKITLVTPWNPFKLTTLDGEYTRNSQIRNCASSGKISGVHAECFA